MSNAEVSNEPLVPNAKRLLWAGFMAILAAGIGFGIRGGILNNWGGEYGFTAVQLGAISGAGLSGFCFGIIIGGVVCDKVGYSKLVIAAFALHVLSAVVTFSANGSSAYQSLYWGAFIFAYANGTLEAVANPLVATLFPHNRTHYLNILHASWPAGLVIGSALGWLLGDKLHMSWQMQLSLYLLPTLAYGVMFLGQHMPKSEASEKGLSLGEMLKDVGVAGALVVCYLLSLFCQGALGLSPAAGYGISGVLLIAVAVITRFSFGSLLLFVLFVTHALVGAVELGTDSWIQNITGNLFTSEEGKYLFIWTSALMFGLRFCANFIEKRLGLSPVGILVVCAILACTGLNLASSMTSLTVAFGALAVYAIGKTFFWPTMLAVASDRFPRTGAIAISIMGGIGMLSGGMIGGPGLGYAKDRFATEALAQSNPAALAEYKATTKSSFLFFSESDALDGTKLAEAQKVPAAQRTPVQAAVAEASIAGDRKTLKTDAYIPALMAAIYLLLLLYFKTKGGYKVVHLAEGPGEKMSSS